MNTDQYLICRIMTNLIIIRFLEWSDYLRGRVKSMMWFHPIYHDQMAYMIMDNPIKTHRCLHNTRCLYATIKSDLFCSFIFAYLLKKAWRIMKDSHSVWIILQLLAPTLAQLMLKLQARKRIHFQRQQNSTEGNAAFNYNIYIYIYNNYNNNNNKKC